MRILIVADPHYPIPPIHYGGAERIISTYISEFQRKGHTVNLLAHPSSAKPNGFLWGYKTSEVSFLSRAISKLSFSIKALLASLLSDVTYTHCRYNYLDVLLFFRRPTLHCFHNIVQSSHIDYLQRRSKHLQLHFVSNNQMSPVVTRLRCHVQHNFTNLNPLPDIYSSYDHLTFLGRLTYNKGVDVAIQVALKSRLKLVIAGTIGTEPCDLSFFNSHVKPFLDSPLISYIGPIDDTTKTQLLSTSLALLLPIRWEDPCPVVVFESLACGCPVISPTRASIPEIIRHQFNGYLCSSHEPLPSEFANAISHLNINRQHCRRSLDPYFTPSFAADNILSILETLLPAPVTNISQV